MAIAELAGINGCEDSARWRALMGRLLLSLATVVMVLMPWTQQVWTWDRFLHGGQDFETGVLLILTSLCLLLVLVHVSGGTGDLLVRLRWLPGWRFPLTGAEAGGATEVGVIHCPAALPKLGERVNLPLQI